MIILLFILDIFFLKSQGQIYNAPIVSYSNRPANFFSQNLTLTQNWALATVYSKEIMFTYFANNLPTTNEKRDKVIIPGRVYQDITFNMNHDVVAASFLTGTSQQIHIFGVASTRDVSRYPNITLTTYDKKIQAMQFGQRRIFNKIQEENLYVLVANETKISQSFYRGVNVSSSGRYLGNISIYVSNYEEIVFNLAQKLGVDCFDVYLPKIQNDGIIIKLYRNCVNTTLILIQTHPTCIAYSFPGKPQQSSYRFQKNKIQVFNFVTIMKDKYISTNTLQKSKFFQLEDDVKAFLITYDEQLLIYVKLQDQSLQIQESNLVIYDLHDFHQFGIFRQISSVSLNKTLAPNKQSQFALANNNKLFALATNNFRIYQIHSNKTVTLVYQNQYDLLINEYYEVKFSQDSENIALIRKSFDFINDQIPTLETGKLIYNASDDRYSYQINKQLNFTISNSTSPNQKPNHVSLEFYPDNSKIIINFDNKTSYIYNYPSLTLNITYDNLLAYSNENLISKFARSQSDNCKQFDTFSQQCNQCSIQYRLTQHHNYQRQSEFLYNRKQYCDLRKNQYCPFYHSPDVSNHENHISQYDTNFNIVEDDFLDPNQIWNPQCIIRQQNCYMMIAVANSSESQCFQCQKGFYQHQNTCIYECPSHLHANHLTGKCYEQSEEIYCLDLKSWFQNLTQFI